jgi:uncharacterized protein with HEPN domain
MQRNPAEVLREDQVRLVHMLASARRVARYCAGLEREALGADQMRLFAVVKCIEAIGEASTKVSELTTLRITGTDWRGVRRMRNRPIHGYDSIDVGLVWDAASMDIPPLIAALESALASWPTP